MPGGCDAGNGARQQAQQKGEGHHVAVYSQDAALTGDTDFLRQLRMLSPREREATLKLLEAQVRSSGASIPAYDSYLTKMRFAREGYQSYLDVPYLPVSVFKSFELCSVPREQVARVLKSSGTTTGKPSRIYLDKTTSFRQTKALINTLKEVLGNQKLPYLVLDCKEINAPGAELTARGAVCRGFMISARSEA